MATLSHLGTATWTTTAGNKTVVATPAVGDLIIIVCANSGRTTAQAPTVTDNNSSGAYVQIGTPRTKNTSADSLWMFARTTLVPAASSTTFTFAPLSGADSGGGLDVFKITGMAYTGTACLVQSGGQSNTAAATPSITMGAAIKTLNVTIGAVFTGSNSSTNTAPPTSWTEATDLGYNTPTSGIETCFRNGGETLTTVPWTAATPSEFCSMLVEINTGQIIPEVVFASSSWY